MYCGCILKFQRPPIDLIMRSLLCKLECVFEWMSAIARQYICPWTKCHMWAKSFFCLPLDHWSILPKQKRLLSASFKCDPRQNKQNSKKCECGGHVMYTIPYKSPSPYGMWYWPVRCKPEGLSEASQMPWLLWWERTRMQKGPFGLVLYYFSPVALFFPYLLSWGLLGPELLRDWEATMMKRGLLLWPGHREKSLWVLSNIIEQSVNTGTAFPWTYRYVRKKKKLFV